MLRTLALASALVGFAAAQSGYGRFPCTVVNGDGTFSADQTQCTGLVAPGSGVGTPGVDAQGDLPVPVGATCQIETETGAYFCGIAGAACASDAQCDNGICTGGVCQGGFGQLCANNDDLCSGFLYCQTPDFTQSTSNTCGGAGAFCQDYTQGDASFTDAQNFAIFNQFCGSGYCNFGTGACGVQAALGGDCSTDPEFGCATGLVCNAAFVCEAAPTPSGARARARRAGGLHRRNLCPADHSACSVPNGKGFECIDTQSNLEQCGACASSGGVDCTAIEGADAVGCVAGVCEIWSCHDGFTYDAAAGACVAALVL
ncbi:hypothetical protein JCM10207_008298 [Rhodosporidiobolus poonsookiae]